MKNTHTEDISAPRVEARSDSAPGRSLPAPLSDKPVSALLKGTAALSLAALTAGCSIDEVDFPSASIFPNGGSCIGFVQYENHKPQVDDARVDTCSDDDALAVGPIHNGSSIIFWTQTENGSVIVVPHASPRITEIGAFASPNPISPEAPADWAPSLKTFNTMEAADNFIPEDIKRPYRTNEIELPFNTFVSVKF